MEKLKNSITIEHYHDLGKWLLCMTAFYTYVAFSQYFLIWYSNLPVAFSAAVFWPVDLVAMTLLARL